MTAQRIADQGDVVQFHVREESVQKFRQVLDVRLDQRQGVHGQDGHDHPIAIARKISEHLLEIAQSAHQPVQQDQVVPLTLVQIRIRTALLLFYLHAE